MADQNESAATSHVRARLITGPPKDRERRFNKLDALEEEANAETEWRKDAKADSGAEEDDEDTSLASLTTGARERRRRQRWRKRKVDNRSKADEGVIHVGRIGDVDVFSAKLKDGQVNLEDFRDAEFRQRYEQEHTFRYDVQPVSGHALRMARHHSPNGQKAQTKKLYYREYPRFTFLGRYDFEEKDLFVLLWTTVPANRGGGESRLTKRVFESHACEGYCRVTEVTPIAPIDEVEATLKGENEAIDEDEKDVVGSTKETMTGSKRFKKWANFCTFM